MLNNYVIETPTLEEHKAVAVALIAFGCVYKSPDVWTVDNAQIFYTQYPLILIEKEMHVIACNSRSDNHRITLSAFFKIFRKDVRSVGNFWGTRYAAIDGQNNLVEIGCQKFKYEPILELAKEIEKIRSSR